MASDLYRQLRRVLLLAGAPLIPLGCGDGASSRITPAPSDASTPGQSTGATPPPACAGGWGADTREGGCKSGPFKGKYGKYLLLHDGDAREKELYDACRGGTSCPNELCERVLQYKPISTQMIDESFVAFVECAPACQDGKPGVHVVYTVAGDCAGRRPEGLVAQSGAGANTELGAFYASMAHLEAASVYAFERLARELAAHGAPAALVSAALRSLEDEARHYRVVSQLARRHGAEPVEPRMDVLRIRSLEEIAVENAVEGSVGETFGAAVVGWQAGASPDPATRTAMRTIAREEAEHAALAAHISVWAHPKLSLHSRRRVHASLEERAHTLEQSVASSSVSRTLETAGVPSVGVQMDLVRALREHVWRAHAA